MRAIQVETFGGPEVMQLVEIADPEPSAGLELMQVSACGVNFADTHATENTYLSEQTVPFIPGAEVVGTFSDGRRMCGFAVGGGYAELALVAPEACFEVPPQVSDGAALSLLVQGLTAWHLLRTSGRMQKGESVVVHAAAGGVGSLVTQLAKHWGAGRIIAVASTEEKRELSLSLGADVAVDSRADDLKAALREANDGQRVDLVLDMVGGATTDASLAALAPFGRLVVYGMASRETAAPIAPAALMQRSRSVIGFWLIDCLRDPGSMVAAPLGELLGLIETGVLVPLPGHSYPLTEARRAHEDLLGRRTTGKVILVP
jgi:NADPH2:quinone reductase